MDDLYIRIALTVIAPVVSILVTLALSEPIKNWLAPIVVKFGVQKEEGISGTWRADFYYGINQTIHTEYIEIKSVLGQFVGRIVPNDDNYQDLKTVQNNKPLRIRGTIKDNRYFDGFWFHPIRRNHNFGVFKLLIVSDGDRLSGQWLGYSETKNCIESGRWEWEKILDSQGRQVKHF